MCETSIHLRNIIIIKCSHKTIGIIAIDVRRDALRCSVCVFIVRTATTYEHGSAKINQRQNMTDAVDGNAQQHNYVRQRLNLLFFYFQVDTLQTHLEFYAVNYQVKRTCLP